MTISFLSHFTNQRARLGCRHTLTRMKNPDSFFFPQTRDRPHWPKGDVICPCFQLYRIAGLKIQLVTDGFGNNNAPRLIKGGGRSHARHSILPFGICQMALPIGSKADEVLGAKDEEKGKSGDNNLADGADGEGAEALFAHFAEVGAQADAGEG